MPLFAIIGITAWASVVLVVVSLCRMAARSERAMPAARPGHQLAMHEWRAPCGLSNSRGSRRAREVAHRRQFARISGR
jgi:hypothetical protein